MVAQNRGGSRCHDNPPIGKLYTFKSKWCYEGRSFRESDLKSKWSSVSGGVCVCVTIYE